MNLSIRKSPFFQSDILQQYGWYFDKAGEELAWQFFTTVDRTLVKLSGQPDLGRFCHFQNASLHDLQSLQVDPPFRRLLIFYRHTSGELIAERLMHGSRDLPRRLVEPPGA
jgi:plasmid stabilization system protein ParE